MIFVQIFVVCCISTVFCLNAGKDSGIPKFDLRMLRNGKPLRAEGRGDQPAVKVQDDASYFERRRVEKPTIDYYYEKRNYASKYDTREYDELPSRQYEDRQYRRQDNYDFTTVKNKEDAFKRMPNKPVRKGYAKDSMSERFNKVPGMQLRELDDTEQPRFTKDDIVRENNRLRQMKKDMPRFTEEKGIPIRHIIDNYRQQRRDFVKRKQSDDDYAFLVKQDLIPGLERNDEPPSPPQETEQVLKDTFKLKRGFMKRKQSDNDYAFVVKQDLTPGLERNDEPPSPPQETEQVLKDTGKQKKEFLRMPVHEEVLGQPLERQLINKKREMPSDHKYENLFNDELNDDLKPEVNSAGGRGDQMKSPRKALVVKNSVISDQADSIRVREPKVEKLADKPEKKIVENKDIFKEEKLKDFKERQSKRMNKPYIHYETREEFLARKRDTFQKRLNRFQDEAEKFDRSN